MTITAFSKNYKKRIDQHIKFYLLTILIPMSIPLASIIAAFIIGDMKQIMEINELMGNLFNLELNYEKIVWATIFLAMLANTIKLKNHIKYRKISTLQAIQILADLIEKSELNNESIRILSRRKYPKHLQNI